MKLTGFLWGGAAVVAAISGWAFWLEGVDELTDGSDRVVERVDRSVERIDRAMERVDRRIDRIDRAVSHAIDRPNPNYLREMERLQPAIDAGEIDLGDAIDQAIQASIDGGTGPGTERSEPAEEAAVATAIFSEVRSELDAAEQDIRSAREAGEISAEEYSDALASITRAQVRIEEAERAAAASTDAN